jgi:hypothetical protein
LNLKAVLVGIYYFLKLSIQSLGIIVKATIRHRSAKATFKKTLLLHGIPLEAAQELSKAYPNPVTDVLRLMSRRRGQLLH